MRPFLLLIAVLASMPSFGAELAVEYSVVARSAVTAIPGGVGKFTGFGSTPAIDANGNVVFTGSGGNDASGKYQGGVYTAVGTCCQKVADRNTAVPGRSGVTFDRFLSTDRNDIDGGRVAFLADVSASTTLMGAYSNVGQASASSLVEVAVADGSEWSVISDPWVDGTAVALRGRRLLPSAHDEMLVWNGTDSFLSPGTGYIVSPGTVASIDQGAAVFRRYKTGYSELGVHSGGVYQTLVLLNTTLIPGHPGVTFSNVNNYPVVDRGGLDVAFRGHGPNGLVGLYKRANGGALTQVADNTTVVPGTVPIPGAGDQIFKAFVEDGAALANGKVVFWATGQNFLTGLYTDIGGGLSALLDNADRNTIVLNGITETITDFAMSHKALAYTSQGYMVVFKATFASGASAIIRATIGSGSSISANTFTVRKDFSDNSTASVSFTLTCTSGTVTNNPQLAREGFPAVFTISGASAGATCKATEPTVPTGYTRNQTDCQNGDPLNGSCTIINTKNTTANSFTVYKDFSDNNSASVSISLTCTSGTVTNTPRLASEGAPAVFSVSGAATGTTCKATEPTVPTGYTRNQTDCQNGDPLNGSCTIINTKSTTTTNSFTVRKDFSDNNTASVSITLTCTSGTVTNNPRLAREGFPAVFSISGASAGATCKATEPTVPTGYTRNQTDCQNGDPLNGSCTIVNTKNSTGPVDIVRTGFETGQAEGWSLTGGAKVDSTVAIGKYALWLENNGTNSVRSVSTAGYSGVSVTMNLAARDLQKGDTCHAELSTNGGSTWTTVLQVSDGLDTGTFRSATVSPTTASNNANLRLRFRVVGNGNRDNCWGDEIIVRGTPISSTSAAKTEPDSLLTVAGDSEPTALTALTMDGAVEYASPSFNTGFDPGFDHLFGDGSVDRQSLSYELLMKGEALDGPVDRSAFAVPAGAAPPEHVFEGWLQLRDTTGQALPDLNVLLVQVGNHLFPLATDMVAGTAAQGDYVIGTGRVWRENGDHGFSRAFLPFLLVQPGTGCAQDGVLTFLFSDDGVTSNAVYQVSGGHCGAATADRRGVLEAVYSPAAAGEQALGIEAVLGCAADNWLPLVQGRGGFSRMLMPGDVAYFALRDGDTQLWLDAAEHTAAIGSLCE